MPLVSRYEKKNPACTSDTLARVLSLQVEAQNINVQECMEIANHHASHYMRCCQNGTTKHKYKQSAG
jgi:hypothetical protein